MTLPVLQRVFFFFFFSREQLQLSLRKSGRLNAHIENAESYTAVYLLSSGPSVSLLQQLKVITFILSTEATQLSCCGARRIES